MSAYERAVGVGKWVFVFSKVLMPEMREEKKMPTELSKRKNPLRLWQFVKRQIIADVPEDLAICEFDCRKEQCMDAEWASCERRIRKEGCKCVGDIAPSAINGIQVPD